MGRGKKIGGAATREEYANCPEERGGARKGRIETKYMSGLGFMGIYTIKRKWMKKNISS